MSAWQDIATAPQGEWVLLYGSEGWQLGFYMRSQERWHTDSGVVGEPTHWMPLPEPPVPQPCP